MLAQKLTINAQQTIVKNFLQEFFPPVRLRHKLSSELIYIHTVVNKAFKKNWGFTISLEMFLETCLMLGYQMSTRKASYDPVDRLYKPDKEGTFLNTNPLYKKYNAAFIYLNIEGKEVHNLMKTVFTKSLYKVQVDEDVKHLMAERLLRFKVLTTANSTF